MTQQIVCPACDTGKHRRCDRAAWNVQKDTEVPCPCTNTVHRPRCGFVWVSIGRAHRCENLAGHGGRHQHEKSWVAVGYEQGSGIFIDTTPITVSNIGATVSADQIAPTQSEPLNITANDAINHKINDAPGGNND